MTNYQLIYNALRMQKDEAAEAPETEYRTGYLAAIEDAMELVRDIAWEEEGEEVE